MKCKFFACVALLCASGPGAAACFQANPMVPPSSEIRVYVGETPHSLMAFGESPYGRTRAPYPPPPPAGMTSQEDRKIASDATSITLWYFEPNPRDKSMRVCRSDLWGPRKNLGQAPRLNEQIEQQARDNPLSARLLKQGLTLAYSTTYAYDSKGRIEEIAQADLSKDLPVSVAAQHCNRYDDSDRVVLWVNPEQTKKCPKGAPSPGDEWREFKFASIGGKEVELRSRWHIPKKNGRWREEWSPFQIDATAGSVDGNALVNSRRGVTEIFGSSYGKLDNNAANMVVDVFGRWEGANYTFPKPPVAISLLEHPEELYRYERRRMTNLGGHVRLYELFQPNEHISRHRFYMLDGYVLRHEQLDGNGRITRIITLDDWRQPRPGPKPDFDDKLLAANMPKLFAHQVYHRVYDVDAGGRPTLVALSWNRSLRIPLKRTSMSLADVVFGTPDGKEKWKNRDEFDKAFNTSEYALQVFPDSGDEDEDE